MLQRRVFTCWNEIDRYQLDRATLRTFLLMLAKYISLDQRRKLTRKHPQLYSIDHLFLAQLMDQHFVFPCTGRDIKTMRHMSQFALPDQFSQVFAVNIIFYNQAGGDKPAVFSISSSKALVLLISVTF